MTYYIEDLQPGMSATIGKTITDADIVMYAGVSTDTNAVHLDEEFGKSTQFGGRIAHGMLTASFISAALGSHLPGPGCIYLGQTLKFKAPVRPGDTVKTTVTVKEVLAGKRRVILDTTCRVGETVVIEGEATVMVGNRPA
jgi:3-hydroxybutyryl-CoA dehydratase